MESVINPNYWLVNIDETTATVALISPSQAPLPSVNIAPAAIWAADDQDTLVKAIDAAILDISTDTSLPENEEPDFVGFVVPPFWVGSDGKIIPSKLNLIEKICRELNLKPLGFVPSDEAIVEHYLSRESTPQSFVLIYFDSQSFVASLVIVGKITQRIRQPFGQLFDPQTIQDCFALFPPDSVFPPQIILFGQTTPQIVQAITNFRWPSFANREFFLHLPEVISLNQTETFLSFSSVIVAPIAGPDKPPTAHKPLPPAIENPPLAEVEPSVFDFDDETQPELEAESVPESKPAIKLPKFSLPSLKFPKFKPKIWLIPVFLLIFVLLFYLLPSANVTIFLTPFSVDEKMPVTLNSKLPVSDFTAGHIATSLINIDIASSATTPATATKIVGDKAQGEITVYNKVSQVQNLPRGLILSSPGNKKYELASPIQVPSSNAKLDQGIIEMGQTKVSIIASDIGPEFNLSSNVNLNFKDHPETELVARTSSEISGGSRSEVKVISPADKTALTQTIKEIVNKAAQEKAAASSSTPNLLSGSWQTKTEKIQFNREIGEVSDLLSATGETSLTAHLLSDSERSELIKYFLSQHSNLSSSTYNLSDFSFEFIPKSFEAASARGELSIKGFFVPEANVAQIAGQIAGRRPDIALDLLRRSLSRLYDWRFTSPLNLVETIGLFPLNPNRISVEIKSQ